MKPVKRMAFSGVAWTFLMAVGMAGEPGAAPAGVARRLHFLLLMGQSNTPRGERIVSEVKKAFPGDEVVMAKVRVGACSILGFYKKWPAPQAGEKGAPSAKAIEATGKVWDGRAVPETKKRLGDRKPDTVTFLWMQGERDGLSAYNAKVYAESLKGLIRQVREHLGREDVNVVIARISDARSNQKCKESWALVRKSQEDVAEADPRGAWFDTDDLNGPRNSLHYTDYAGLEQRFAEKTIDLIKNNGKRATPREGVEEKRP